MQQKGQTDVITSRSCKPKWHIVGSATLAKRKPMTKHFELKIDKRISLFKQ